LLKKTQANCREAPEISNKSKKLALKKGEDKEVHERLFTEKLNKQKTHLYKEKEIKGKKKKQVKEKVLPSKLTKEEVGNLVGKLHQDANERKIKREKEKNKIE